MLKHILRGMHAWVELPIGALNVLAAGTITDMRALRRRLKYSEEVKISEATALFERQALNGRDRNPV